MSDYITLDYGTITDSECAQCGDLLAEWESNICCICEAMAD